MYIVSTTWLSINKQHVSVMLTHRAKLSLLSIAMTRHTLFPVTGQAKASKLSTYNAFRFVYVFSKGAENQSNFFLIMWVLACVFFIICDYFISFFIYLL